MVRLDNPYSFNRPRPLHYLTVAALFLIAYMIKKYASFPFAYQFALPIMLIFLLAYIFDRTVLSKKMIIGGEFPELGRIYFFIIPLILTILFMLAEKIFRLPPAYYLHFSSNDSLHRGELFALMVIVAIPAAEIVFRGYFQFLLSHLFGKKAGFAASVITYVLFFLLLTNNSLVICYTALMGMLFSYISYRESSILPSIIAHEIILLAMFVFKF